MKWSTFRAAGVALTVLSAGAAPAEDLAGTWRSTNLPGAEFPRVEADGRVTFQLRAPQAKAVQLQGGEGLVSQPLDLVRGGDGTWSGTTTSAAEPGFHYHWFMVDGLRVNDPATYTYFGWGRETSGVEVPEAGVRFYHFQPESPRGTVSEHWYASEITGKVRRAHVYAPPGYGADTARRYPVLYLLHGAGESERSWVEQGRLQFIMDNLHAGKRSQPMMVVVDSGYAAYADNNSTDRRAATAAFEDVLLKELIPMIDREYRTQPEPAHRAMAGLSMGGGQTLRIALRHPEVFSWIGAMSAASRGDFDLATAYDGAFRDAESFRSRCRLLWLGAGTSEPEILARATDMHGSLEAAGIANTLFVSRGTGHEWQTWRRSLHDLAPRLFVE